MTGHGQETSGALFLCYTGLIHYQPAIDDAEGAKKKGALSSPFFDLLCYRQPDCLFQAAVAV
jgi:uncharacterized membrane protein